MTATHNKQLAIGAAKIAAELTLVAVLVVGVCWGLENWAEHQANRPIRADSNGVVTLTAAKATLNGSVLNGSVERGPNDKEKQTDDFAYHFGRELLEERNSRTISNWTGQKASVEWQLSIAGNRADETKMGFNVHALVAATAEAAGNRFVVSIVDITDGNAGEGEASITSTVVDTGGWDKWEDVSLGAVELSPGIYRLRVTPDGPIQGGGLMGLSGIELRPTK